MAVLKMRDASLGYGVTTVLHDVTIAVEPGIALALIGANGSGKSTLLKGIIGLCSVTGSLELTGEVGYVPQHQDIDSSFPISAKGVVEIGLYATTPWWRRIDSHQVNAALSQVNLMDKAVERFGNLSGGQRQRVLIARALVTQPALMLLDEPFNGLDTTSRDVLVQVLTELKRQGAAIIVSTHDYSLAEQLCEQTAIVANGRITVYDTDQALTHHVH